MFLAIGAVSAVFVIVLRVRRSGWTLANWRNDLFAIVLLAAFIRIFLRVLAL